MKAAALIALLLLGSAAAPPVRAAGDAADEMIAFADHLFEAGDYYRAITEYERVAFHHPAAPAALRARYRIALSYYRGEKYADAARRFREFAARHPDDALGEEAAFMAAEADYKNGDTRAAAEAIDAYLRQYPAGPRADAALVLLGRCRLREGEWKRAAEIFGTVSPGSASGAAAAGLAAGARRYPDVPRKSPALAGMLSAVLPGAGQLYVGRRADAAAAFFLNALFVWAAVEAFDNHNDVTGGILVAFEAGWYSGNIFNAVGSAHKYNRRARQEYLDGLENQYGCAGDTNAGTVVVRLFSIRR